MWLRQEEGEGIRVRGSEWRGGEERVLNETVVGNGGGRREGKKRILMGLKIGR